MINKLIEILEKLQQDHERIIDGSQVYADIDINTEAKELLKQVKNCNTPDVSGALPCMHTYKTIFIGVGYVAQCSKCGLVRQ